MRAAPPIVVSLAAFVVGSALPAAGQPCELGWQPGFGWDPPAQASHTITTAAPQGREIVFVGGEFTSSVLGVPLSRVASFDGERWDDLQGGVDGTVYAVEAWDPDGAGPRRELVVAVGDFSRAGLMAPGGAVEASRVAAWDGEVWAPVGEGLAGEAGTLAVCDIDGDGVEELFATFLEDGLEAVVSQFDGAAWQAIGRWPASEPIRIVAKWDRDAAGPEPARLMVAAGMISRVWDGAAWSELPPTAQPILGLAALARDAGGTLPPTPFVNMWQGLCALVDGEWRLMRGRGYGPPAEALVPLDRDGAGPEREGLFFNTYRTVTLHGLYSMLTRYPGSFDDRIYTVDYPTEDADIVNDIAGWHREPGKPPEFWLARQTIDLPWQPGSVTALSNEPDRMGLGMGPVLTLARVVSLADVPGHGLIGAYGRSLARYDGEVWRWWVAADDPIRDRLTDDERVLYIAGGFSEVAGQPVRGVGVFEEGEWRQLGEGLRDVEALAFADLGQGRRLYAVGRYATVEGQPGISEWDGVQWRTIASADRHLLRVIGVDPDGDGPLPAELVVTGLFRTIGGVEAPGIAAFDGESWRPLDASITGTSSLPLLSLAAFDPDGAGPQPVMLHAPGADGRVWRLVDDVWEPTGSEADRLANLTVLDRDGGGLAPSQLFGIGEIAGAPGMHVARLEGERWASVGEVFQWCGRVGLFGDCVGLSLSPVNLVRQGQVVPAIALAGAFLQVDQQPAAGVALWIGACPCPADCDGDGELTILDFLCFQNLFGAHDPGADCDGDGAFTFFDFLCFQNAFAAGCP